MGLASRSCSSFANICCRFSLKRPSVRMIEGGFDTQALHFISLTYFCRYIIPDWRRHLLWIEAMAFWIEEDIFFLDRRQPPSLDRRLFTPNSLAQSKEGLSPESKRPCLFLCGSELPLFHFNRRMPHCTLILLLFLFFSSFSGLFIFLINIKIKTTKVLG